MEALEAAYQAYNVVRLHFKLVFCLRVPRSCLKKDKPNE
jgi:hypothetical protein